VAPPEEEEGGGGAGGGAGAGGKKRKARDEAGDAAEAAAAAKVRSLGVEHAARATVPELKAYLKAGESSSGSWVLHRVILRIGRHLHLRRTCGPA
jgi:hypothetical protein